MGEDGTSHSKIAPKPDNDFHLKALGGLSHLLEVEGL